MDAKVFLVLMAFAGLATAADAVAIEQKSILIEQFKVFLIPVLVLCYVFACGRIADFIECVAGEGRMMRREVLGAPLAYIIVIVLAVAAYFSSGASAPPQGTPVSIAVYFLVIPLFVATVAGAIPIYAVFRDRLNPLNAIELSTKILFAPVYDGLHGYWTALGAAALLVILSGIAYYSGGGNIEATATDLMLLSSLSALAFVYLAFSARETETRASRFVTAAVLVLPGIIRIYFKQGVCTGLAMVGVSPCPLAGTGEGLTLMASVGITLGILVPIVPFAYAFVVNLLRFYRALKALAAPAREKKRKVEEK